MTELEPAHPREGCGKAESSRRSASTIFGIPMERGHRSRRRVFSVAKRMGHADLDTTQRYVHLSKGHLEEEQKKIEALPGAN